MNPGRPEQDRNEVRTMKYYFAYGSNMNLDQMAYRCPDAEVVGRCVLKDYRLDYVPVKNQGVTLINCKHFTTAVYDLDEPMTLDYSELDSFVILVGIKGEAIFTDNEGNKMSLRAGESMLVPATTETLNISGNIKFLETYV